MVKEASIQKALEALSPLRAKLNTPMSSRGAGAGVGGGGSGSTDPSGVVDAAAAIAATHMPTPQLRRSCTSKMWVSARSDFQVGACVCA